MFFSPFAKKSFWFYVNQRCVCSCFRVIGIASAFFHEYCRQLRKMHAKGFFERQNDGRIELAISRLRASNLLVCVVSLTFAVRQIVGVGNDSMSLWS